MRDTNGITDNPVHPVLPSKKLAAQFSKAAKVKALNKHVGQCGQRAPRIVFLDFDGVILESVEAKEDAYRALFKDYPNRVKEIVAHYRTHAGLPRTERLRQVVGEILGEVVTEERIEHLRKGLAAQVARQVKACTEVDGLRKLLRAFSDRCYVVSAAPEEEVRSILEERGLARFFIDIFGSPRLKLDVLRDVLSSTGVAPAETVFVGDSINDCRAATRAGVPFVARIGMHGPRMPPGGMHEELHSSPGWPRIKSLDELLTFLQCRGEG